MLERIAKDPQAFIRQQGWAAVSLDGSEGLLELRSLYEHLQARILELIETLDTVRASPDYEIFQVAEQDEAVIERIAAEWVAGIAAVSSAPAGARIDWNLGSGGSRRRLISPAPAGAARSNLGRGLQSVRRWATVAARAVCGRRMTATKELKTL